MSAFIAIIVLFSPALLATGLLILKMRTRRRRDAWRSPSGNAAHAIARKDGFRRFCPGELWLTYLLLAILTGIFVMERRFAIAPQATGGKLSVLSMLAEGGVSRNLVRSGQWYRLFTAPFLHASWAHLIGNGIAFFFAGHMLEKRIGRLVFGDLFVFRSLRIFLFGIFRHIARGFGRRFRCDHGIVRGDHGRQFP